MGRLAPVFDVTSHFHAQYFAGLLVVAVGCVAIRKWRLAGAIALAMTINLTQLLPFFVGGPSAQLRVAEPDFTLMSINVQRRNQDHDAVRAAIRAADPDAFALIEVDQRWVDAMADLESVYPHTLKEPRDDNFGIAFYSRLPVQGMEVKQFVPDGVLSVIADFETEGGPVRIVAAHPLPPLSRSSSNERNAQLAAMGKFALKSEIPFVIIGDLNTTPWNCFFKEFAKEGRLIDSAKGFGLQPTWPGSWVPKMGRKIGAEGRRGGSIPFLDSFLVRIPIDHCLHSEELETIDRIVGEYVGSDHLPLTIKLRFRGGAGGQE